MRRHISQSPGGGLCSISSVTGVTLSRTLRISAVFAAAIGSGGGAKRPAVGKPVPVPGSVPEPLAPPASGAASGVGACERATGSSAIPRPSSTSAPAPTNRPADFTSVIKEPTLFVMVLSISTRNFSKFISSGKLSLRPWHWRSGRTDWIGFDHGQLLACRLKDKCGLAGVKDHRCLFIGGVLLPVRQSSVIRISVSGKCSPRSCNLLR